MSFYLKDPHSRIEFPIVWGTDFMGPSSITDSVWGVAPAGLAIEDLGVNGAEARAMIGGGTPGEVYRVTNEVTLLDGRSDVRSLLIRVEKR